MAIVDILELRLKPYSCAKHFPGQETTRSVVLRDISRLDNHVAGISEGKGELCLYIALLVYVVHVSVSGCVPQSIAYNYIIAYASHKIQIVVVHANLCCVGSYS